MCTTENTNYSWVPRQLLQYFHIKTTALWKLVLFIGWTRWIPALCAQGVPLIPRISLFAIALRGAVEAKTPLMEWAYRQNGRSVKLTTKFRLGLRSKMHRDLFHYTSNECTSNLDSENLRFAVPCLAGNYIKIFSFSNVVENINFVCSTPCTMVNFSFITKFIIAIE